MGGAAGCASCSATRRCPRSSSSTATGWPGFGVECLEAVLAAHGRAVVVLDDAELPDDLARDLTEVLTSMCARLYGRRSASRRAAAAVVAIRNEPDEAPGDPS